MSIREPYLFKPPQPPKIHWSNEEKASTREFVIPVHQMHTKGWQGSIHCPGFHEAQKGRLQVCKQSRQPLQLCLKTITQILSAKEMAVYRVCEPCIRHAQGNTLLWTLDAVLLSLQSKYSNNKWSVNKQNLDFIKAEILTDLRLTFILNCDKPVSKEAHQWSDLSNPYDC